MPLSGESKSKIIKEFARGDLDTGSPEVQIALLSKRITELADHFDKNIKGDSFYSYLKYFDNLINVYQFGVCVVHNESTNISIGMIRRYVDKIYDLSKIQNLFPTFKFTSLDEGLKQTYKRTMT